jgi:hypothetical protein
MAQGQSFNPPSPDRSVLLLLPDRSRLARVAACRGSGAELAISFRGFRQRGLNVGARRGRAARSKSLFDRSMLDGVPLGVCDDNLSKREVGMTRRWTWLVAAGLLALTACRGASTRAVAVSTHAYHPGHDHDRFVGGRCAVPHRLPPESLQLAHCPGRRPCLVGRCEAGTTFIGLTGYSMGIWRPQDRYILPAADKRTCLSLATDMHPKSERRVRGSCICPTEIQLVGSLPSGFFTPGKVTGGQSAVIGSARNFFGASVSPGGSVQLAGLRRSPAGASLPVGTVLRHRSRHRSVPDHRVRHAPHPDGR